MPELPEVETIRRGITPHVVDQRVAECIVREPRLRFAVAPDLAERWRGQRIANVRRRSKYLLLDGDRDTLLIHLGMSGRVHVLLEELPLRKHDHVDIVLESGTILRYHDPRRFGFMQLCNADPAQVPLLAKLGPEPLEPQFDGDYLHARLKGRTACIKTLLMDAHIVVGVGNIYAQEALFTAGIRPGRAAGRLSRPDCRRLVAAVKAVLEQAVQAGGTTLRDFTGADGAPGYFQQDLHVYGRAGSPCRRCGAALRLSRISGRSTTWCAHCQPR